jgi:hypothetical protein
MSIRDEFEDHVSELDGVEEKSKGKRVYASGCDDVSSAISISSVFE